MKLIDKDAVFAEIEKVISGLRRNCNPNPLGNMQECLAAAEIEALNLIEDSLDTIKEKDVDLENYNKVKRTLSLSFMNFLDNNLQEGKRCLSNGECFDIDKAFDEMDFAKLFRYMKKYLKL